MNELKNSFSTYYSNKHPHRILNWVSHNLIIEAKFSKTIQLRTTLLQGLILIRFSSQKTSKILFNLFHEVKADWEDFIKATKELVIKYLNNIRSVQDYCYVRTSILTK